jgi:O-antigen/teichoic acid export membrane protein
MALKSNIAANYASQLYSTLIGILLVPLYLQYLGAEAYGLVGFFALLQTWFNLLDIGLTPSIARETARFQGGALSAIAFRRVHRALSVIFLSVALIGGAALLLAAEPITERWLHIQNLKPSVARLA